MLNNTTVSNNLTSSANTTSISISEVNSDTLDKTLMLVPNKNHFPPTLAEHANGWIINTSPTNHMTSDINLLNKESIVKTEVPKKVFLPNSDVSHVLHIRNNSLSTENNIENVFHVPQFTYNLLSVSKRIKELRCSTIFYPGFCVFQELFNCRVKDIGKELNGLYGLHKQPLERTKNVCFFANNGHSDNNVELWHKRLGRTSSSILKRIFPVNMQHITTEVNKCNICPCAKQTRNPFPASTTSTATTSELIHVDLWGP